ncbi:MAG: cytochrome C oxidase subunit IV family protein [Pyrinomonadaceae bacterium]|nr:cytochrome C oxidase subunit IV family protein [Pyrinomonadaceae bacterium]
MAEKHTPHDSDTDEHSQGHHIVSLSVYAIVFAVLFFGTIITYFVATIDLDGILFPGANTLVALLIAFTKMICVVLFFMHVYWSSRLIWLTAIAGFFWLAIMFAFTMQDYLTRGAGVFTR